MMQLPERFRARMEQQLGEEASRFFAAYDQPRTYGLRVNTLKCSVERCLQLLPFRLQSVPWCSSGFYYNEQERPGKHPLHAAGVYYLQEPSAMAVAELAAPRPGEWVLDLCAAPGGKSTHLAALMQDEGLLVSNEVHPARAKILAENIERLGIRSALVSSASANELAERFGSAFDCIVVDAPCSGEGMFRKDPDAVGHWNEGAVCSCAETQSTLLDEAYRMLRPGGRLVFSTCTFSLQENEQNVLSFLERHADMSLQPASLHSSFAPGLGWNDMPALEQVARLWPHRLQGEGHFLARFVKAGPERERTHPGTTAPYYTELDKELQEFAADALTFMPHGPFTRFGDHIYQLPTAVLPAFSGWKLLRPGWPLGELRKQRFVPSHALALGLRPEQVQRVLDLPPDGHEAQAYLRGQTLQCDLSNGWALVTVSGFSLGWGKVVNFVLKNHYPKGLRWL